MSVLAFVEVHSYMENLSIKSRLALNDGHLIPHLGFGVYQSPAGKKTVEAVKLAFEAGYRHIDTAAIYNNEREVGKAFASSGLSRSDVYITTKLWNADQGYETTKHALAQSLERLDLDYVDLYLLHWPVKGKRLDSWRALVELQATGKIRSIGVSNFTILHLEELFKSSKVRPAVNQVEFSPFLYQKELLEFCQKNKIALEAYSPLTRAEKLADPRLKRLGDKYKKTPAQILIRWALQRETIPLPKSITPERIVENAGVFDFEINENDLAELDAFHENYRAAWDPTDAP